MRLGLVQHGPDGIGLLHSGIAQYHDMNWRVSKAIAGHLSVPPHRHFHFPFLFLLFEENVRDLMTCFLVTDDDELPRLTIAARGSPPGTLDNLSHRLIRDILVLVESTDASPLGR